MRSVNDPSIEGVKTVMTSIFNDLPTAGKDAGTAKRDAEGKPVWQPCNSVAIVSGGLDSVTLVYHLIDLGMRPHVLSFNYGQRHKKELTYAGMVAKRFGLKHDVVDLQTLTHLISNSALTSYVDEITEEAPIEVPEGHYAEDNMRTTVVPNRNMIMLSIAAGVAVNFNYTVIATGVHAGDHYQYPDCRPSFIYAAAKAIWEGNEGFHSFKQGGHGIDESVGGIIHAPFLHKSKADIAERAFELGVPLHTTWSCYKGGDNHCGRCGTCVERLEAIAEAKSRMLVRYPQTDTVWADSTVYDDSEFWLVEVAKKANENALRTGQKTLQIIDGAKQLTGEINSMKAPKRHMPLDDDAL